MIGQRDKEGGAVPLDAHDPVDTHVHPMTTRGEVGKIVPGVPKDCVYKASERCFMQNGRSIVSGKGGGRQRVYSCDQQKRGCNAAIRWVTMIPNIHYLTRYCERYSWGEDLSFLLEPQPVPLNTWRARVASPDDMLPPAYIYRYGYTYPNESHFFYTQQPIFLALAKRF